MEAELLKDLGKIAGIGGISLGVFLILFREVIRKKIFPSLEKDAAYRLLRLVLVLTWAVAIVGIGAWTLVSYTSNTGVEKTAEPVPQKFSSLMLGLAEPGGELATSSHIVIRGNADDYELGWYKGVIRLTGYFVIHDNVEMHQGMVFVLRAVPASDVLLKQPGAERDIKKIKLPRFELDVVDDDTLEKFENFLYKRRGQLVFVKTELSERNAKLPELDTE